MRAAGSKWEEIINEDAGEESELDLSLFAQSEAYGEHWRGLVRLAEARQRVPSDVGAWRDNLYDGGRTPWGMGSIGTVLAVPISPHWMVVLMDASVYEWEGERGWPPIYKMRRRDEDRLALETMHHCRGEIVFLEKDRKWMERCLSRAYAEHKLGVRTRRIPGLKTHPELEEIAREMASQRRIPGIPQRSWRRGRPEP